MKNVFELNVNDIVYRYNNNAVEALKILNLVFYFDNTHNRPSGERIQVEMELFSAKTKESTTIECRHNGICSSGIGLFATLDKSSGTISNQIYIEDCVWAGKKLYDTFVDVMPQNVTYSTICVNFAEWKYFWKDNQVKSFCIHNMRIRFDVKHHAVEIVDVQYKYNTPAIKESEMYNSEKECREANEIQIFDFPEEEEKEFEVTIEQVSRFTKKVRAKNFERAQALVEENYYSGYYEDEILENQMAFFEQVN